MSDTPTFSAEVATGFPAVPLPEYDQTAAVFGCAYGGTYEPRPWGSSDDVAAEFTSGPAIRDARHLVVRTSLGLIVQRVEESTPGSYNAIVNSAFTGTAIPTVVSSVVPRDEGEVYIRFVTGADVGVTGATYYVSDDNGRIGATDLYRLGTASRITLSGINAAIDLEPPAAQITVHVTRTNELRTEVIAHFAFTTGTVHTSADTTSDDAIASACTNVATSISLMATLLAALVLHFARGSGQSIHINVAGDNTTSLAAATTAVAAAVASGSGQDAIKALAALTAAYALHLANTTAHTIADATNVVTSPVPTTGTVVAGDIIRVSTVAPAWSNTFLADAFDNYGNSNHDASIILISGRILPANFATIVTGLNALEGKGKRCVVIAQARKRADGETEAQWRAALDSEWAEYLDYRVAVCAGDGLATFTDGTLNGQYARGFSTQAVRRLMSIDRFRTAWEVALGRLEDFTISDANGIVIGHDEATSPGLKASKFWTVYRPSSSLVGRVAFLNFDITRFNPQDRVRSVRVNRITNRMIAEIQAVGLSLLGKTYDVKRTGATSGTLAQSAVDAIRPKFEQPIQNGFQADISDWNASDLIVIGQTVVIDPDTDAFDLVVTINYTPKLPVGRVRATFAVRLGV